MQSGNKETETITLLDHTVRALSRTLSPSVLGLPHTQARSPAAERSPASQAWSTQSSWVRDRGNLPFAVHGEGPGDDCEMRRLGELTMS